MLRVSTLSLVLVLAQLLPVPCAPIGFQIALIGKVSPECIANQELLKTDLSSAKGSLDFIAKQFDTAEVKTVRQGIAGAMQSLSAISTSSAIGRGVDVEMMNYLMSNTSRARNELDTIFGVPNIEAAAELTSAGYSLIDAVQDAGAVANSC